MSRGFADVHLSSKGQVAMAAAMYDWPGPRAEKFHETLPSSPRRTASSAVSRQISMAVVGPDQVPTCLGRSHGHVHDLHVEPVVCLLDSLARTF